VSSAGVIVIFRAADRALNGTVTFKLPEDFGGVRRVNGALGVVLLRDAGPLVAGEPCRRFQASTFARL
jgi:hypothetical protein